MKRLIIILLIPFLAIGFSLFFFNWVRDHRLSAAFPLVVEWGGVIEAGEDGNWNIVKDESHKSFGLKRLVVDDNEIQVHTYHDLTSVYWGSLTVSDALASQGVICGMNIRPVGDDMIQIQCGRNGKPIPPSHEIFKNKKSHIMVYMKGEVIPDSELLKLL